MCKSENNSKMYSRDYNPDFNDLKNKLAPDIKFVCKEKLIIQAHKIVLAQDDFWKYLFISMTGASGVCPAEPLVIFLPEIEFETVKLMLKCYYKGSVKLKKTEADALIGAVRNFNPQFCVVNDKCRICKADVNERKLYQHVIDHVKTSAKRDINSDATTRRCSFYPSEICTLERDRRTVTNGIFNDFNENDQEENMVDIINEHYRRHVRDELNYLRHNFKSIIAIPTDESSYSLAEINTNNTTDESTHMTTDRLEDTRDDYSGGMSSPDLSILGEELNLESKSSSRRSSIEDDTNKNQELKCKHCEQILKRSYFRQHYAQKHIYQELEQFIMREKGVDENSTKCMMCNGKKGEKVWEMRKLVKHIALSHDLLSHYLRENGEELYHHYNVISKSRNPSGESSEAKSGTLPMSNKSKDQTSKNKSETEDNNSDSDDSPDQDFINCINLPKREETDVVKLETQPVLSGNTETNMPMEDDSEDEKATLPANEIQDPDKMEL